MAKYRANRDYGFPDNYTVTKGTIVEGDYRDRFGKKNTYLYFKTPDGIERNIDTVFFKDIVTKVDDSTPVITPTAAAKTATTTDTSTITNQQAGAMLGIDTERMKKIANASSIGGTIGMIGGLVYAFKTKKKFWGYVGFAILGSIGGSLITNVAVRPFIKKTGSADTGAGDSGAKKSGSTTTTTSSTTGADDLYSKMVAASKGQFKMAKDVFASKFNSLTPAQKEVATTMVGTMSINPDVLMGGGTDADKKTFTDLNTKMGTYSPADIAAVNAVMKG